MDDMWTKVKSGAQAARLFYNNSVIHSRYFSKRKQHWTERFWSLIAIGFSLYMCGSSIRTIWIGWCRDPVTITFTEQNAPISAVPFPQVTICSQTKTTKDKLDLFSAYHALRDNHMNLSETEVTRMGAMMQICRFYYLDHVQFGEKFADKSIFDLIQDMAPAFNDTFDRCEWQYDFWSCTELFSPMITADGVCFTFNALNSRDIYTDEMAPEMMIVKNKPSISHWNLENGYDNGVRDNDYPIRVFNSKQGAILNALMQLNKSDFEGLCRGAGHGFKVILSTPGEELRLRRRFFRLPVLEKADVAVTAKMMTTSDKLRSYSPNERKCYFESERKLRFYKFYTKINCEIECLSNFTLTKCGCVRFYMPRDKDTKICGPASLRCYRKKKEKLYGEDIVDGLKDKNAKAFRQNCNCLPACTTISYEAINERVKFNHLGNLSKVSMDKYSGIMRSSLSIFFNHYEVKTFRRSALYTSTDFLAICGGLLGLFLGFSVLSVFEFIYFTALRLYWTYCYFKLTKMVNPIKRNFIISRISIEALESQHV